MNKKYCKFCGGIMIFIIAANFYICNKCGHKDCHHPDLPIGGFYYDYTVNPSAKPPYPGSFTSSG